MHNTAIEIIKSFTKKEIIEFRNFLKSPYFNSSEMVLKLYELLLPFYPGFKDENLSYEYLSQKLYEGKRKTKSTIDTIFSRLSHLAERFLIQIGFERTNKLEYACHLAEIQRRGIKTLFKKTLSLAEKNNAEFASSNGDYFVNRFRIETSKYNFKAAEEKTMSNNDISYETECMVNASKYLICFFIFEVFKSNYLTNNYYQTFNLDKNSDYTSDILNKINITEMLKAAMANPGFSEYHFLFEIYYYLHLMVTDKQNESYYYKYKTLIKKHSKQINADENSFLYGTLLDYCMGKDTPAFTDECKNLFEIILTKGYYRNTVQDHIPLDLWRNILVIGLKNNSHEWINKLLDKHEKYFHHEVRNNIVNYSRAVVHFERKSFEDALNCINKVKPDYFTLKYDERNLKLKIFYEMGFELEA